MSYRLEVFLDGIRDTSHHCDGVYDVPSTLAVAVVHAMTSDQAISEIRVVKVGPDGKGHNGR